MGQIAAAAVPIVLSSILVLCVRLFELGEDLQAVLGTAPARGRQPRERPTLLMLLSNP